MVMPIIAVMTIIAPSSAVIVIPRNIVRCHDDLCVDGTTALKYSCIATLALNVIGAMVRAMIVVSPVFSGTIICWPIIVVVVIPPMIVVVCWC